MNNSSIMKDMLDINELTKSLNVSLNDKGEALCSWCPRVVPIHETTLGVCHTCTNNYVEGMKK